MPSIVTVLLLAAIVLFILSAFGISSRIGLRDIGLACLAASLLLSGGLLL